MGRSTPGIYRDADNVWCVDKIFRGTRLRERFGEHYAEAESWLIQRLEELRQNKVRGIRLRHTFDEAAANYLIKFQDKVSLTTENYLLQAVMPHIGALYLDEICNDTLKPMVTELRARYKSKSINLMLGVIRRIVNLAARDWREPGSRQTWLHQAPLITMVPLDDQRPPRPISWSEQRILLPLLPDHLARMALFDLNTAARDDVVCNLQWEWEIRIEELELSVFRVPKEHVKGRKRDRYLVLNKVAQSVIESVREEHPVYVFTYHDCPLETMNNTAWQNARRKAGLGDLHVHDLRHTVGMRLREADVREETISDILWHNRPGMTAHYSVAQVRELSEALKRVTNERYRKNRSLEMISRESASPQESPRGKEKGQVREHLTL